MKNIKKLFLLIFISGFFISGCSKSDDTITGPGGDTNRNPNAPSSPTPSNGQVNLTGNVTVTWQCTDPDASDTLRYDVKIGSTANPTTTVATNVLNRAADIGVAGPDVVVYWRVIAKDNHGGVTNGPVWSYRTAP